MPASRSSRTTRLAGTCPPSGPRHDHYTATVAARCKLGNTPVEKRSEAPVAGSVARSPAITGRQDSSIRQETISRRVAPFESLQARLLSRGIGPEDMEPGFAVLFPAGGGREPSVRAEGNPVGVN